MVGGCSRLVTGADGLERVRDLLRHTVTDQSLALISNRHVSRPHHLNYFATTSLQHRSPPHVNTASISAPSHRHRCLPIARDYASSVQPALSKKRTPRSTDTSHIASVSSPSVENHGGLVLQAVLRWERLCGAFVFVFLRPVLHADTKKHIIYAFILSKRVQTPCMRMLTRPMLNTTHTCSV